MSFNKYRLKGAYHFDWYETEEWYRLCVDACVDFCKGTTLDVGCGDGLLLSKLPAGSQGIDNDPDGIKLAKAKGLDAVNWHADKSFPKKFEHLDHPEALKRIIKRNITKGAIIMTLEWQGGAFGEDHRKEYSLLELEEFFKEFKPKPFRIKGFPEWIGVKITL